MIAIDTSSLIAYLSGLDVEATGLALEHRQAVLPPVLSELLSELRLRANVKDLLVALPMLDLVDGYWERAGLLQAKTLARKRKAALADVLVAQACLDHDVELVTRDHDFDALAVMAGLRLIPAPARRSAPEPTRHGSEIAPRTSGRRPRPRGQAVLVPAPEGAQLVLEGAGRPRTQAIRWSMLGNRYAQEPCN